ncbi:sensor histidine kinase [Aeromicrobium ponti]|uniref:histidine kinase n=2 Tax=Cytobacillus oceanisediminis TaxID=665099 RepID=A0A562K2V9_9BACI|nr:two-component system sensor histidine kinase YcbA [Cytobacillus oceanisediminis]
MNSRFIVKNEMYMLVLMVMIVPLAGELNFYPFNQTFRISFGAPAFFFFLLLFRKMPAVLPGFLTAAAVVGFRILIDLIVLDHFDWTSAFQAHIASFFFYFTFSCLVNAAKISRFYNRPLIIGVLGIPIEVLSDLAELIAQYFILGTTITATALNGIMVIAMSHSFIVISFFNMLSLYEAQSREREIRKQNEQLLMLISNLYEESVYLKKTLKNTENITKKSYDLYKSLNGWIDKQGSVPVGEYRQKALEIAGEVHEVKKDNQRIFSGLSKLISDKSIADYMDVHELVNIIVRANEKYADLLGKDIKFVKTVKQTHPHYHVFTVLSIINNVVANAAEAIGNKGIINISIDRHGHLVEFMISDNGPGIPPKHKALLFKPGFTTKYDHAGNPSTGIGLSYVKEIVEQLDGDITFHEGSGGRGLIFIIRIPINQLVDKG